MTPANTRDASFAYAARGWHTFPLVPGMKIPATPRGHLDATNDRYTVARWFADPKCNIGISTGASGLLVIDIDGRNALSIFEEMAGDAGLPHTYRVKTRSEHGQHFYFRSPHHFEVKSSAGLLGPGIDVRAAGGYVVAPPSFVTADRKGPSGTYEVMIDAPVAELPYWLGERLHGLQHPAKEARVNIGKICRPETPRHVALLRTQLTFISADCGYERYRSIIWAILSSGWSCAEQLALEWSKSAPDRFDELTFHALVRYFDPTRPNCPSLGSIYFAARQEGWDG